MRSCLVDLDVRVFENLFFVLPSCAGQESWWFDSGTKYLNLGEGRKWNPPPLPPDLESWEDVSNKRKQSAKVVLNKEISKKLDKEISKKLDKQQK